MDERIHLPVEIKISLLKLLTDAFIECNENAMDDIRADIILNHYRTSNLRGRRVDSQITSINV